MTALFYMTVPPLLPKPQGRPEAMTEMAAACNRAASELFSGSQSATSAVGSMMFTAPVASRLRGTVAGNASAMSGIGDQLSSFASELEAGAVRLQERIDKYEQRLEDRKEAIANNRAFEAAQEQARQLRAAEAARSLITPSPLFR